jgi:uncharacterized surface protein with fasciclin (FAS1) repeats
MMRSASPLFFCSCAWAVAVEGPQYSSTAAYAQFRQSGATVAKTDIGASNGVIHFIDTVIVPE